MAQLCDNHLYTEKYGTILLYIYSLSLSIAIYWTDYTYASYNYIYSIYYIYISSASRGWACVCLPSLVSPRWSYERRSLESQEIPWNALQFFLRNWFYYSVLSSYPILSYQKIVPGMQSSLGPSHHRQVCNAKSHAIAPVEVLTWSRLKVCSNKMRACIQTSTNLLHDV